MPRKKTIRPPSKGKVSASGLWSLQVGERPYTVTLREDRAPGARILFDYTEHGRRRQVPSGIATVRTPDGQFDAARINAAEDLAKDRSARVRLDRLREDAQPQKLTVDQAFELYFHPERGGLAPSKSSQDAGKASRRDWTQHLGGGSIWNRVLPSEIDALARRYKRLGMLKTAEQRVKWLRTVYRWLKSKARMRGLEDPTEHFDFQALMEGYEPHRPRYSLEEVEKILAVRWKIDPRFALLTALMDDSGTRRAGLIHTWRSALDRRRDIPPPPELAPHGWILYPALKGQDAVLHFLTEFERREIEMALTTHLSELERRYQEEGVDYPLFPAARMYPRAKAERLPIPPSRDGAYRAIGPGITERWLADAERLAGVDHVEGRLWHGWRRLASDVVFRAAGLGAVTTAMGWKSQRTPEQIYIEDEKHFARSAAREAMEHKRRKEPK